MEKNTRRNFLRESAVVSAAGAWLGSSPFGRAAADTAGGRPGKEALLILGDAWHCVAPLHSAIAPPLRARGYEPVSIMDYAVPFDDFARFGIIVLSRYAFDDLAHYRAGAPRAGLNRPRWLTPGQEQKFEDYVNAGGRLLLHHDGIGFYARDGAISRLAKAFFIKHPPIVEIEISPTGKMPELTRGITPFRVTDEEFQVEMDETRTTIFLESHSSEHGRAVQGWAHPFGKGKVAVLIPGHHRAVLEHPMVRKSIDNAISWLEV